MYIFGVCFLVFCWLLVNHYFAICFQIDALGKTGLQNENKVTLPSISIVAVLIAISIFVQSKIFVASNFILDCNQAVFVPMAGRAERPQPN